MNLTKDNEIKIKEMIYLYLEDASTLNKLPVSFLPNDILYQKGKLDFTTSDDIDDYVENVFSAMKKDKLFEMFEQYEGIELNNKIILEILVAYHQTLYYKISMEAKQDCLNFFNRLLKKYGDELGTKELQKFKKLYKIEDKFYERGLLDYDYNLLNSDLASNSFKKNLKNNLEKEIDKYIQENNLNKVSKTKNNIKSATPMEINQIVTRDVNNFSVDMCVRIIKIMLNNKNFYNEDIKKFNVKGSIKIPYKQRFVNTPIVYAKSSDYELYITAFSAYIKLPNKEIKTVYHINRNTLKECLNNLGIVIKKYKFNPELITFAKILPLR